MTMMISVCCAFAGVLFAGVIVFFLLHCAVNDRSVPKDGWKPSEGHRVLAIFAHPDDELMAAGTLAAVKDGGGQVYSLYFTHGEDGPTGGLVEKDELGRKRFEELQKVKECLGEDEIEVLSYPDRYLGTVDREILKQEIKKRVERLRPDTVLCFDDTNGLYGHDDHVMAGSCTQEFLAENAMGVENLLVMTLPKPMIRLARRLSKTFRERYHEEKGLPAANLAVPIARYARRKYGVIHAHATQWQVMGDVQPMYDKMPPFLYYRIFSREYFSFQRISEKRADSRLTSVRKK